MTKEKENITRAKEMENYIKNAGLFLVKNAEDIVKDLSEKRGISLDISIDVADASFAPTISINKQYYIGD